MKKRSSSAFTLIELLVVISIIVILATLGFAGMSQALVAARKLQAKNDMAQIANAIHLYNTEYGRFPCGSDTPPTGDTTFGVQGAADNSVIISILRARGPAGWDDPTKENPRRTSFMEPKMVEVQKGGVYSGDGNWYDPWGFQYIIFIDSDYDGDLTTEVGRVIGGAGTVSASVGVASVGLYYAKGDTGNPDYNTPQGKKSVLLSWK